VTDKSTELNIPIENVLTPELLRRLAWAPPEPIELETVSAALTEMGARRWQVDAIAAPVTDAFIASLEPDVVEPSEAIVEEDQTTTRPISDQS